MPVSPAIGIHRHFVQSADHRHVTRIGSGVHLALLVGLVLLIDVLLLLLDLNLDILDPGFDLDVVARSNSNTACGDGVGSRCHGVGAGSGLSVVPNVGDASNARLVAALCAFTLSWPACCSSSALASALDVASIPSSTANRSPVCSTSTSPE